MPTAPLPANESQRLAARRSHDAGDDVGAELSRPARQAGQGRARFQTAGVECSPVG